MIALGLLGIAAIALLASESPFARWILSDVFAPERLLAQIGLGAACGLVSARISGAVLLLFGLGIVAGSMGQDWLLWVLYNVPEGPTHLFPDRSDRMSRHRPRTRVRRAAGAMAAADGRNCRGRHAVTCDHADRSQPARPGFHMDARAGRILDRCRSIADAAGIPARLVSDLRTHSRQLAGRHWPALWRPHRWCRFSGPRHRRQILRRSQRGAPKWTGRFLPCLCRRSPGFFRAA